MKKQDLIDQIRELVVKDKTSEALQLLSSAQLSENDKIVVILMRELKSLDEDIILDKITNEELNRRKNSINNRILTFSERLDQDEIEINEHQKKKKSANKAHNKGFQHETTTSKTNILGSNKKYLLLLLILPITFFVLKDRINSQPEIYPKIPSKESKPGLSSNDIWERMNQVYFEDFSNRYAKTFNNKIWSLQQNSNDFWAGVENDEYYAFKINSDKPYTRYKYLGGLNYDAGNDVIAYAATIKISDKLTCVSQDCIGRGLIINYSKSNQPAYALTVNDNGEVSFTGLTNFKPPLAGEKLFYEKIAVQSNGRVKLGITHHANTYAIFINDAFVKEITVTNPLKGKYCGVIASGNGDHYFDEILLKKY